MKPTIVYISSDNRSGSTLLDQLLGSNRRLTSVGEVIHVDAYAREDRALYNPRHPLVCSCGLRLAECPFWSSVERAAGRSLGTFRIHRKRLNRPGALAKRFRKFAMKALMGPLARLNRMRIARWYAGGLQTARESFELFDAIGTATGAEFIVDSSKDPYRFLSLHCEQPERVKVILLARDYRGVVNSKMKRDMSLGKAIRTWNRRIRQMDEMANLLPAEDVFRVTYEELCLNTEAVMRRLCDFIGIDFTPGMLVRDSGSLHHLGGSPSKFDTSRKQVSIDTSYLEAFSPEQLEFMRSVAGRTAERWGYS
jgi:hypothetical protein